MFTGKRTVQRDGLEQVLRTTTIFKILSDPTRFKILCHLMRCPDGACVYEIAEEVNISHSAASHQLAKLESRGIVSCYRDGQSVCYELIRTPLARDVLAAIKVFKRPS